MDTKTETVEVNPVISKKNVHLEPSVQNKESSKLDISEGKFYLGIYSAVTDSIMLKFARARPSWEKHDSSYIIIWPDSCIILINTSMFAVYINQEVKSYRWYVSKS